MTPEKFERKTGLTTRQAAAVLGIEYPRYMEFRRGARVLKPYYIASMEAHALLSGPAMRRRLAAAGAV